MWMPNFRRYKYQKFPLWTPPPRATRGKKMTSNVSKAKSSKSEKDLAENFNRLKRKYQRHTHVT